MQLKLERPLAHAIYIQLPEVHSQQLTETDWRHGYAFAVEVLFKL
jgi:hypothetical protein